MIEAVIQATKIYQSIDFLNKYRKISYLHNKKVTLKIGHQRITGQVVTIDDQGRIVIKDQNTVHHYSSGEVVKVEFNFKLREDYPALSFFDKNYSKYMLKSISLLPVI